MVMPIDVQGDHTSSVAVILGRGSPPQLHAFAGFSAADRCAPPYAAATFGVLLQCRRVQCKKLPRALPCTRMLASRQFLARQILKRRLAAILYFGSTAGTDCPALWAAFWRTSATIFSK